MPVPPDPPFSTTLFVRANCLCLHVQRAARALARRYDEALRPIGLTSGQFSLLMSLNRPEPPNMAQVSTLLGMDRTTLTSNLKPLERQGLIELIRHETDGRRRILLLTPAGRSLLAIAMPIWLQTHQSIEASLGNADVDQLRSGLQALS